MQSVLTDTLAAHDYLRVMARRLRIQYPVAISRVMSLKWIAERLQMGSWTYVSNLLPENQNNQAAQEVLPLCQ